MTKILDDPRCAACAEPVSCPRGHTDGVREAWETPPQVVPVEQMTEVQLQADASEFASQLTDDAGAHNFPGVRLETENGGFVGNTHHLPMNTSPDVVIWGERLFLRTHRVHQQRSVYAEGFAISSLAVTHEED